MNSRGRILLESCVCLSYAIVMNCILYFVFAVAIKWLHDASQTMVPREWCVGR